MRAILKEFNINGWMDGRKEGKKDGMKERWRNRLKATNLITVDVDR